jgi:hypothetical protein
LYTGITWFSLNFHIDINNYNAWHADIHGWYHTLSDEERIVGGLGAGTTGNFEYLFLFIEHTGEMCIIILRRNEVSENHTTHPRLHTHVTSAPIKT